LTYFENVTVSFTKHFCSSSVWCHSELKSHMSDEVAVRQHAAGSAELTCWAVSFQPFLPFHCPWWLIPGMFRSHSSTTFTFQFV